MLAAVSFLAACRKRHSVGGVQFRKISHGGGERHYLHVHGNEATARELLEEHMKSAKGTAFIVRSVKRNVALGALEIDPNRMFSRAGAERSLRRVNAMPSEAAIMNVSSGLAFAPLAFMPMYCATKAATVSVK